MSESERTAHLIAESRELRLEISRIIRSAEAERAEMMPRLVRERKERESLLEKFRPA